jgi:hypothetical protein
MENSIPDFVKGPYPSVGIKKLIADFKTYLDELETLAEQNETSIGALITSTGETESLADDIRAKLKGNYLVSLPWLAIGTTPENVANIAFDFQIFGVKCSKDAVAAGTALSGDDVPAATYGAWRLEIRVDGTIDIVEAADNATGYADAELAIAGLPDVSDGHASMGVVTATNSDAVFSPGVTSLAAATVTATYADSQTAFQAIVASAD